jgi:hypothetical protein
MFSGLWLFSGTGIVEVNVCKEKLNIPIVGDLKCIKELRDTSQLEKCVVYMVLKQWKREKDI